MSGDNPPITCKELKSILTCLGLAWLGFVFATQKGSHEQWVLIKDNKNIKLLLIALKRHFRKTLLKAWQPKPG